MNERDKFMAFSIGGGEELAYGWRLTHSQTQTQPKPLADPNVRNKKQQLNRSGADSSP